MDDFKSFAKDNGKDKTDIFNLVKQLADKYDGKDANEILSAIFKEAKKGKENGTLTNAQLENFANTISPFLTDKQRSYLSKILSDLKKI